MSYVLSCCSTADLSKEHFEKRDINYVCFHFYLDEEYYPDDLGQTMPFDKFYKAMEEGAMTKTSQVNVAEFEEYFESFLKEGKDILHITLASGISGVNNSANIAKNMMEEKYPDRKIYVVDSCSAACGYGMLMDTLADMRDAGKSIDEIYEWVEANKSRVQHWLSPTDLKYLIRGGRVSKASGFVGQMLNICPVLIVAGDGTLKAMQKVRTKKKVLETLANKVIENTEEGAEYAGKCYVAHSACEEDAKTLVRLIEEKVPALKDKVVLGNIGTVIGSHTGPGALLVCFFGNERA